MSRRRLPSRNPLVLAGLAAIAFYRKIVSPALHAIFGGNGFCRFSPTCSEYARRALLEHGFFKGSLLAAWRILRCNPLCPGGNDPVPPRGSPLFRRERIGIFGGSFDPVHNAHLILAKNARERLKLDRVIFIPAAQSPLKNSAPGASAELRLAMLRAATDGVPAAEISAWEIARGGKSLSLKTVEHFEEIFPRARFFWIFGADQLAQLDLWFEAETLCRKVIFAAMRRDGETLPDIPASLRACARVVPLDVPPVALSSTEIRRECARGNWEKLRDCVPAPVLTIIRENKIYCYADDEKNDAEENDRSRETLREARIRADKEYREPCWNDR